MPVRQVIVAGVARQMVEFPGHINTIRVRNLENVAGRLCRVYYDDLDQIGILLNPGEMDIWNAEDTSSDMSGMKMCTKRIWFTGQVVGPVVVEIAFTLKSGFNQTPNRPANHPVQV